MSLENPIKIYGAECLVDQSENSKYHDYYFKHVVLPFLQIVLVNESENYENYEILGKFIQCSKEFRESLKPVLTTTLGTHGSVSALRNIDYIAGRGRSSWRASIELAKNLEVKGGFVILKNGIVEIICESSNSPKTLFQRSQIQSQLQEYVNQR
jgi:hypothetical protein